MQIMSLNLFSIYGLTHHACTNVLRLKKELLTMLVGIIQLNRHLVSFKLVEFMNYWKNLLNVSEHVHIGQKQSMY